MGRPPKVTHEDHSDPDPAPVVQTVAEQPAAKKASATVTFTGDPRGGVDPTEAGYGGMTFPKGKAVSVDADWLKANPNIKKNNHFKVG